jgi:hypothetical protein
VPEKYILGFPFFTESCFTSKKGAIILLRNTLKSYTELSRFSCDSKLRFIFNPEKSSVNHSNLIEAKKIYKKLESRLKRIYKRQQRNMLEGLQ